jgi:hypothetical protein
VTSLVHGELRVVICCTRLLGSAISAATLLLSKNGDNDEHRQRNRQGRRKHAP